MVAQGAVPAVERSHLWPFWLALAVVLIAVPLVRRVAVTRAWYDHPDGGLKPHEKPVPYLGGVGIYAGWLAAILAAVVLSDQYRVQLVWIAAGGTVLTVTGLIDDVRHVPPKARLFIQAAVGGGLLYGGVGRGVWAALAEPLGDVLPQWAMAQALGAVLSILFCMVVLAGATNSTNLIDGLDGLCAGIVAVAALGFAFLVTTEVEAFRREGGLVAWPLALVVCAGLMGACLGFLRHNFHPASIFMGDSGSLLLGFNVAVLIVLLVDQASWRGLVCSVAAFGFPVFDTALAIARRRLNGRPLFVGDRSHFYDQLCDRGLSVRRSVVICYGLGALFAVVAGVLMVLPTGFVVGVVVVGPIVAAVACLRLGFLRVDDAAEQGGRRT
jgi:UDP-GlcNAc:undecaprenyl-phosphate GlcNAc-1-phosphate transferase